MIVDNQNNQSNNLLDQLVEIKNNYSDDEEIEEDEKNNLDNNIKEEEKEEEKNNIETNIKEEEKEENEEKLNNYKFLQSLLTKDNENKHKEDIREIKDIEEVYKKYEELLSDYKQIQFDITKERTQILELINTNKKLNNTKLELENYCNLIISKLYKSNNDLPIQNKLETSMDILDNILNQNKNLSKKVLEYKQKIDSLGDQNKHDSLNIKFNESNNDTKKLVNNNKFNNINDFSISPNSQENRKKTNKNSEIETLKKRLKNYKAEISHLKQANELIIKENNTINNDIKFYKSLIEQVKKNHDMEINMLHSELYDLALQYTVIKNEIKKNINK